MEEYPETMVAFEKYFNTEQACRDYISKLRWPEGFRCPRCGGSKHWITQKGLYRCGGCDAKVSVTAGTIFQDTRLPLRMWFRAIWHIVTQKHGISGLGLQRVLGFRRYATTWILLHKLRTAMVRPCRERLSGIVEVDEIYVGGERSGKRGRGAEHKSLVIIAVEDKVNHLGRIRLSHVKDASAESLIPAIRDSVEPGSTVRTDGWSGYNPLEKEGYKHIIARPSEEIGKNLLPLANRIASLLKRVWGGTHQGAIRSSHLDYYLDEFTFRFNRRTSRSRGKLFYRLMQQTVAISPVKGVHIYGGKHHISYGRKSSV